MDLSHAPPSPEEQLTFLSKLQRLFAEGDFTATYKHALLISLADLAVELGADDGRELVLSVFQIGERFIQLYWHHAVPYGAGRPGTVPGVLVQNYGTQAAVITAIAELRARFHPSSPQTARQLPEYASLLRKVSETVSKQPLTYLQNFGGGTDPFLYERGLKATIRLKPGVTYCLRRFQPLVQRLARTHWIEYLKGNRLNQSILGGADDLETFLFETPRQALGLVAKGLLKLDGRHCFYCGRALNEIDVDHFIPFAQYPRDLTHNFVLAHPSCNRSKSDMLAGKGHLERWLERLLRKSDALTEIGFDAGIAADAPVNRQVAAWAYTSARTSSGRAWIARSTFENITQHHLSLFAGENCSVHRNPPLS